VAGAIAPPGQTYAKCGPAMQQAFPAKIPASSGGFGRKRRHRALRQDAD
jgi:hypothetical protein